ncbi:hypothetical protein VOLCADRAFT_99768 [Volvox carteri f. nagariensis]|uniref:Calcineurin-like phosphoesterase domain-containing protein n=1 Tax=Volvox carteri f. nagariensis TaxID=3068 RepID=D8UIL4_VOLCA|nr:uncharacterized protein VOLCADRAFT_99768 [Volvox carteri f. nagariensis]EFJ40415.1 hypothetical protein VOLCADRAFT_99768 [Volvox carteri f. nagariensis]|eukprot:XP_002958495.1 hypothetical protein VOLCADRAFT_99768 [Volvox carteri f. nagariensis]
MDVIALAGDIGHPGEEVYRRFLAHCGNLCQLVFLVPGNHKYYGSSSVEAAKASLRSACSVVANAVILDNSSLQFGSYTFVGSTLWCNMDDAALGTHLGSAGDYLHIPGHTPDVARALHRESVSFLEGETSRDDGSTQVVITHHWPSMCDTVNPVYHGDPLNCCYYNNLDGLVDRPAVAAWLYGHTHHNVDTVRACSRRQESAVHPAPSSQHRVRLVSNQFRTPDYQPNKLLLL